MADWMKTVGIGLALGAMPLGAASADEAGGSPAGQLYQLKLDFDFCSLEIQMDLSYAFNCSDSEYSDYGVIQLGTVAPVFFGRGNSYLSNECESWPEIAVGETADNICWISDDLRDNSTAKRLR